MIRVTYRDVTAPVVSFHNVQFKTGEAVEVPDDWSGLEPLLNHPHFSISVDEGHAKKPQEPEPIADHQLHPISIGEARAAGREAYTHGARRQAPAHYSGPQRKAWLEGFDRARRKARR